VDETTASIQTVTQKEELINKNYEILMKPFNNL
jgi:hypothetical protein